jgi:hypothetical protein
LAIITSYSTLQTAVTDYLARGDLSTFTPNFIQNFEERFYRDSKNWASWMEVAFNVTITNGLAAVPAAYKWMKVAYISGQRSPPLKRINLTQLYSRFPRDSSSGVATYIARNATNFEFGPIPSAGTLIGTYYAKPTVMRSYTTGGADAVAHWLIVNAPDLVLYGALLEAEPFLKNDTRMPTWKALYDLALTAYRDGFQEEEHNEPMMVAG